jgi:hypothetical protein
MENRLSASALKALQVQRNEDRIAQEDQQRLKDRGLARIAKAVQSRRDKLEKQWLQQKLDIIRAATSGKFNFDTKAVIWPKRLIDSGFFCFNHDIRKLENAIELCSAKGDLIFNQIDKAQSNVIRLLHKPLVNQFGSIAKVREIFEQADELVIDEECESYISALSSANPKFRRIDLTSATEVLGQLDQLFKAWLNNHFEEDEMLDQLYLERDGGIYDEHAPDRTSPSLMPIVLSFDEEKIVSERGASIRIGWRDVSHSASKDFRFDPDFSLQALGWVAKEGQAFFSFLDTALGDLPLGVDSYDFVVERNVHNQYLVKTGINKFIESPNPAQIERCMQALGYACEKSIRDDDQFYFRLRW